MLLLLLFIASARSYDSSRTVSTSWGVVIGEVVSPAADDLPPVTQFLGIPYGVAPVALERFKMVISASKWSHTTKETITLSPACVQTGMPELSETKAFKQTSAQRFDYVHRLLPKLKSQSEDCLYMNLFVPERLPSSRSTSLLPVLVLIHGDEYGWGSGGPYNGTTLASFGQIVVVTLNYRLGVFGFMGRCESSSCKGNEGMSDIVSALTMLGGILPAFGGNSREITLMGWGSGAALVSLLMASPLTQPSRRLFSRAILLDGTALAPWALSDDPQGYFMQLAEKLQCAPKANRTSPASAYNVGAEDIVRCMQDHSAENITKIAQTISAPSFLSAFAPIVDGQLVPNKPSLLFSPQFGSLFREIDLLVGTVTQPAHHLLSNEDLKHGVSKERKEKIIRTLVRNFYDYHRKEIYAGVVNEYTDWANPKESGKSLRDAVLAILSDSLFVSPLIKTLRAHSSDETSRDANTFFFHFGHETRSWAAEQPNSGIRGALSGDHLPYLLGYPLSRIDKEDKLYTGFDADDRGLARVMMHYVSNFAKSGDPQKPLAMPKQTALEEIFSKIAWPQYNQPNREAYLDISHNKENPGSVKNYYQNARVGFWTGLVPQLHSAGKEGVTVPEEHNFLHDHFKLESFFGKVKSYSTLANIPFPPPPLPPTPPPEMKKTTPHPPSSADEEPSTAVATSVMANYSTPLSLIVIIGCGFLFLNICIFLGMYKTRLVNIRTKKKLQLQYQTYSANHGQNPDLQYAMASPVLQEPLLSASQKTSIAGIRPGVSPTCPRHGRSAMAAAAAAAAASRGNSLASGATIGGSTTGRDPIGFERSPGAPQGPTLEEIQV